MVGGVPTRNLAPFVLFEVTMNWANCFAYALALVFCWAPLSQAYAVEGELQAAQKLASETGRPLLVVAGTDT
jgi:hypothetical protein